MTDVTVSGSKKKAARPMGAGGFDGIRGARGKRDRMPHLVTNVAGHTRFQKKGPVFKSKGTIAARKGPTTPEVMRLNACR